MDDRGQQIGPYRLDERLGEGGQSVVWKATDLRTGARVALKKLHGAEHTSQQLGRLRREAGLLASFSDPGLPRFVELIETPGSPATLVMELIDGQPLHKAAGARALPPSAAVPFFRELVRLVALLHARGIAHRDLKQPNILVRQGWEQGKLGSVVLVDFGIARGTVDFATTYTATGAIIGTFAFLSPELLMGTSRESSPSLYFGGDVYALGIVLWHLLTRSHPSGLSLEAPLGQLIARLGQGLTFQPERHQVEAIEREAPGLARLVERCLAFDPRSRFQNASELQAALGSMGSLGASTLQPRPASPGGMRNLSTSELLALDPALSPTDTATPHAPSPLALSLPVAPSFPPPASPLLASPPPPATSPAPPLASPLQPLASPLQPLASPSPLLASPSQPLLAPPGATTPAPAFATTPWSPTPISSPYAPAAGSLVPPPPARSGGRGGLFGVAVGMLFVGGASVALAAGGLIYWLVAPRPISPPPGTTSPPTVTVSPPPTPTTRTAIVVLPPANTNGVLRAGPGYDFPEIEQIPRGAQIHVLTGSAATVWWHVRNPTSDRRGYMHRDILQTQ